MPVIRPRPNLLLTPGHGVAALTVVMVLFFVMALVAAYTNRNLVFEQRISANSYRATRALEAADAGVEWTLAMLNGGRATANCVQGAGAAGLSDFRSRYLRPAADTSNGEGAFDLAWGQVPANRVYPACIIVNGTPRCICPAVGEAPADINPPANGIGSSFRVTFRLFHGGNVVRGGAVQFVSRGCSNPGDGGTACFAQTDNLPAVDGTTAVIATAGLVRALPVAPIAALTAGSTITATAPGQLLVANGDLATGTTAHAGGALPPIGTSQFTGPAGSGSDGRIENDTVLANLAGQGAEAWFRAMFVLDTASYRRQPAVVRVDCAAGCNRNDIANALALSPRNPIWADGNVNIDAAGALGSAADPMMLIVTGTLTVSGNAAVSGFVHANQIDWSAATATWDGAMVSATSVAVTGVATVRYDKAVLDTIRLGYGSFVRVPGSWNIF